MNKKYKINELTHNSFEIVDFLTPGRHGTIHVVCLCIEIWNKPRFARLIAFLIHTPMDDT